MSATNGSIQNLTATNGTISNLQSYNINTVNLTASNAAVGNLTAGNATIVNSLAVKPGATINAGGNRVQNVGSGILESDAVNLGQLRGVEKMAKQQGAIAAAAVNIPLPVATAVGETTVGAALGYSGGQSALAIGIASRIKEDLILKATAGVSGGTKSVGVGIGYTFK